MGLITALVRVWSCLHSINNGTRYLSNNVYIYTIGNFYFIYFFKWYVIKKQKIEEGVED